MASEKAKFGIFHCTDHAIHWCKLPTDTIEIEQSGWFTVCAHRLISKDYRYPTEKYIGLLKTFPNHAKEKVPQIDQMFEEIRELLSTHHHCITVNVVVDLKIARKKI